MGKMASHFKRFPLLLKFLDCRKVLSVQVHPDDEQKKYIPTGENGKTEAWVVLQTGNEAVIYAGLKPGTTEEKLRDALNKHAVADDLASFKPAVGDSVLIKAGTVHTLGDVVVFEIQENSDVTYRLYDWDRVDEKTGKPRELQVEQALACVDFTKTDIQPETPVIQIAERILGEKLIQDAHFTVWRYTGATPFMIGKQNTPCVLVCIEGAGEVEYDQDKYALAMGDVMLLPAIVGARSLTPRGRILLLEIALPEK
jgi:mannose-6-phosphate isomerase